MIPILFFQIPMNVYLIMVVARVLAATLLVVIIVNVEWDMNSHRMETHVKVGSLQIVFFLFLSTKQLGDTNSKQFLK